MKSMNIKLVVRISISTAALAALSAFAPAQSVEQRLSTLESRVNNLETDKWNLTNALNNANSKIWVLEQKTKYMSVAGTTTKFTGTNVQILKDGGNSETANGLGNLIVGYNVVRTDGKATPRTGSHNIVLGNENSYTTSMGFVGGYRNFIHGDYSCILTGRDGIIAAEDLAPSFNAIITGRDQRVRGHYSGLLTGLHNVVDADYCGIVTGFDNKVYNGEYSAIITGEKNKASNNENVVISGFKNTVFGKGNVIGTAITATSGNANDYNTWYRFKSSY